MPVKQSIKEREERRREHVDSLVLARMLELITEDPEVQEEGFEFEMFVLYTADCLPFRPLHNFLNASKTKKSFDRLDELPDAIWNSLIDKGIKKALWDRLWSTVDRLNQALLFGLTGLTPPEQVNMVLGAPEGLDPSSIVVNYCPYPLPSDLHLLTPVAFFRRRVGYKYCTRIETYVDIYESLNKSREAFDQLVCTVYESGLESPTWLGDQMITEIALILLEDLGYMCKGDATDFQLDKVMSMGEMLEKGDVFVCKCCPDVERVEMDWKGLVSTLSPARTFQVTDSRRRSNTLRMKSASVAGVVGVTGPEPITSTSAFT